MTDPLAGQDPTLVAPAQAPAAPAESISDIEKRLNAQFEERFKGLQQVIAKKDTEIEAARREAREARESTMTDDEKAEAQWSSMETENSSLKRQVALLTLAKDYPEEIEVFQKILDGSSPQAQLDAIRELRTQIAASVQPAPNSGTPAAEPDEPEIPPIDANNPMRISQHYMEGPEVPMVDGVPMTEDLADQVLKGATRLRPW